MGIFDWLKTKKEVSAPLEVPEPANRLEAVLQKAASEPAYRLEFYQLLLSEDLVVITQDTGLPEGSFIAEENTTISIATLSDGRVPVFTSTDRIFDKGVIRHQVPFVAMKGKDLFKMTSGAKFILNPYSDYGKELLAEEITNMLNGTVLEPVHQQITVEKETQVLIGQPASYPEKLVESLKILLATKPAVKAAFLAFIHDPSSGIEPHYIIGLDMDSADQTVNNEVGFLAQSHLGPGEIVDLILVSKDNGISSYFRSTTPFYKR
ncbi:enhanced serine sensitivity protein SseB C-terminal domain-containing protein [Mucilaginibacter sp. UR6-1]|uniref:enhanced serine sensitivity protein SseB C-terminal domain-containing protein n=1 Tax=Mucilaginibacter sp. UR6-1 TaxID=1435643 RepID=UPI001E34C218|nr:enhanced serine sensitivity protein SseB C-terminal domain-containing protein [Mucilaginibacter sp. UR6-1]MCC8408623.1 enhanced serine sensitivity protein SseB C-terminal domain-containing protein [Mucilaginibacter sp. UR6-1]